ncbi:MAG: SEC-C metal-binding domain-containing protein [Anaerolineales bacterium]
MIGNLSWGIEPDQEEDLSDLERKLNPPVRHEVRKIGRNELCTCGSGKKFKKCCGANV